MSILQARKSANQEYVFITNKPEKLTYTIILKNTSDSLAQNIIVKDIMPYGAVFSSNTFSLNGVVIPDANPNCGVNIGDLPNGKMAIITFDVEICPKCPPEKLENYASISYIDCSNSGNNVSFETNVVPTKIVSLCVKLTKSVDKCVANKNDILNYSLLIENNSNIALDDVVLFDDLPQELSLLPQSIFVNGDKSNEDLSSGIHLQTIGPGSIYIVVFQAKVDCIPYSMRVDNRAYMNFNYSIHLEDSTIPSSGVEVSNVTSTSIGPNSFKQLMVSSKLPIPCSKNGVYEIINKFIDVEIVNKDIIDTIKGISCEGERLTGKKIVVNGTLMERIEYIESCSDKSIEVAEYEIPFNTFIVLPENYKELSNLKIESTIENIDIRLIDVKTLYQSVTLLLEVVY